jgi:AraC-like DNA-binding protein
VFTPPPASLVAITIHDPAAAAPCLKEWVPRLRAAHPTAPLVLVLPGALCAEAVHLAQVASQLRIRAVLVECEPLADTLRRLLTQPVDLPADVEEWLLLRRATLPPDLSRVIRAVFQRAHRHHEVTELLHAVGECTSTVRAWFRARALPPPGDWLAVAHALPAVMRLQAEPRTSLFTIAVEGGYSDQSALSRQVHHLFGVRPGQLRGTLGWEWLLDGWLARRAPCTGNDATARIRALATS